MWKRVVVAMVVALAGVAVASAQSNEQRAGTFGTLGVDGLTGGSRAVRRRPGETRPATTTFMGDTGLWFVPIGEVLPAKKWSASVYRVNYDYNQGFTDVSNWPLTFGFGLGDRAEVFGAWTLVRRIDRDVRPIFLPSQPSAGGVVNDYPFVRQGWSDNQLGDLWLGTKVNLTVRVPPAARGAGACAAWSSCRPRRTRRRRRRHRQGRTSPSTRSSARKSTSASSCPDSAASSSAATRTTSTSRTGCAGASAPASRPASTCG